MKKKKHIEFTDGVLTSRMDVGSEEFNEFQAVLLNKSRAQTEKQKKKIELIALKFKMEDYLNSDDKDIKSAGEFLKSYLEIFHIRQNKFAAYIGVKPSNLSKLINGERSINYELAMILGRIFMIDPLLWLEIQAKNELKRLSKSGSKKYLKYSLDDLVD